MALKSGVHGPPLFGPCTFGPHCQKVGGQNPRTPTGSPPLRGALLDKWIGECVCERSSIRHSYTLPENSLRTEKVAFESPGRQLLRLLAD